MKKILLQPDPEQCANCVFYHRIGAQSKIGECRRYPPMPAFIKDKDDYEETYAVPSVPEKYWCGEWTPTEDPQYLT